MSLASLQTPCLILDKPKLVNNIKKLTSKFREINLSFRPHLKTTKCAEIADIVLDGAEKKIMVSTLREAEFFSDHGIKDIIYSVGIVPDKLPRIAKLYHRGTVIHVILDNLETARLLSDKAKEINCTISVLIEIDCDGSRAGLKPDKAVDILNVAKIVQSSKHLKFNGLMTHAGSSYDASSIEEIIQIAEKERLSVLSTSQFLKNQGIDHSVISAGSTPTATFGANFEGLTEARAGVFMFNDLFQANLGVSRYSDIALSVLTTIVGHQQSKNRLIIDAGALALSKDRGTQFQENDCGYGLIMDEAGHHIQTNMYVTGVSQEHGQITTKTGAIDFNHFPIGKRIRILPNHACMTAAPYDQYNTIESDGSISQWKKISGW